jgi:HK97 family phage major capsid protein
VRTSEEIREEIGRHFDRATAILEIAASAKRDLTDEEQAEVNRINGKGKKGEQGYAPGLIDKLEEQAQTIESIEARSASLSAKRSTVKPQQQEPDDPADIGEVDFHARLRKMKVPASARYFHSSPQAFTARDNRGGEMFPGESGEKAAYLAGMFLLATIRNDSTAQKWCDDNGIKRVKAAVQETDNSLGGFAVPTEMERAILNLKEARGVARRECLVDPMGSDTKSLPRRTGGITVYFPGEAGTATASNPTLDQYQLTAKKLFALVPMSSEVSEDSIVSMGDFVTSEIAYGMADMEDKCCFTADGSSTYGRMVGIKNALAAGSIVTATGHAEFSTLTLADFHNMKAALPQYAEMNAKWYISKAGFAASMERLMAAGGGNTYVTLANGIQVPRFLGYDVVFTQVMNSALTGNTGLKGGVILGDLRQGVTLGSRRGLAIDSSPHVYFTSDQIAVRGIERFDINVHEIGTATVAGSIISLTFG